MTWIATISEAESDDRLRRALETQRALYPPEYAAPSPEGASEGIVASHTLIPDALQHAFATFGVLMSPELPLTRPQHEMIATVVSVTNRCVYWIDSHAEFLRVVTLDETLARALRTDYRQAPISPADRAMLDYAVQITKDATRIHAEDLGLLRAAGFNDQAILQITLIAAWFNYINRVADALGVGRG